MTQYERRIADAFCPPLQLFIAWPYRCRTMVEEGRRVGTKQHFIPSRRLRTLLDKKLPGNADSAKEKLHRTVSNTN